MTQGKGVMAGEKWHTLLRVKSYLSTSRNLSPLFVPLLRNLSPYFKGSVIPVPTSNLLQVFPLHLKLKRRSRINLPGLAKTSHCSYSFLNLHFFLLQVLLIRLTKSLLHLWQLMINWLWHESFNQMRVPTNGSRGCRDITIDY